MWSDAQIYLNSPLWHLLWNLILVPSGAHNSSWYHTHSDYLNYSNAEFNFWLHSSIDIVIKWTKLMMCSRVYKTKTAQPSLTCVAHLNLHIKTGRTQWKVKVHFKSQRRQSADSRVQSCQVLQAHANLLWKISWLKHVWASEWILQEEITLEDQQ